MKTLAAHLLSDPVARERLRREAIASASLDHPFICKVFEVADSGDASYIVMEYVEGQTLHERLTAGPLPLAESVRIATEIADALETAHAGRLVHRDLKPANVMLTPQGRVKVMDFGIARQVIAAMPDDLRVECVRLYVALGASTATKFTTSAPGHKSARGCPSGVSLTLPLHAP